MGKMATLHHATIEEFVNYPAPVKQLLTAEAFDLYTTTTVGSKEVLADLQALDAKTLTGGSNAVGKQLEMASACVSGLWLLNNFLDESHDISQTIESPVGSHWHAIMHRLEGDFPNSKYWYRRVGRWDLYQDISDRAGKTFEPMAFVDRVEKEGNEATHDVAVAEWQALFEHCFRSAL